jgi:predicted ester cyclase
MADTLKTSDTVALGHLFADILNTRDLDRFAAMIAPEYVNHNPYAEQGLAGVKGVFAAILAGVPDLVVTAEDVFASADGNKVVGRYRYEGTHTGSFMGFPPTGNRFAMRSIDIWRVEGGLCVEHWDELNTLDFFTQVGAVPAMGQGEAA